MKVRKLRLLRIKHSIQLEELGVAAGLSKQRISMLELGESIATKPLEEKISNAFFQVITERLLSISSFETDYLNHKDSLFDLVEGDYEL